MSKIQKRFLSISTWISFVAFIIRFWIAGFDCTVSWANAYNVFCYITEAIGITGLIMILFNKFMWKWKIVNCFIKHPVLHKKYKGSLMFTWNDQMGERPVEMDIEQTFLNIRVDFKTNESSSDSINAAIEYIGDKPYLLYLYMNTPDPNLRDVSPIHYGHAKFDLKNTDSLVGDYFTDRKTVGRIEVQAVL